MQVSILRKQWLDYPGTHSSKANLAVHFIFVPVFMAGTVAVLFGLYTLSVAASLAGLAAMALSLAAQGWGHAREARRPKPFTSKTNAVARIFMEQWITFPAFGLRLAYARLVKL